MARQSLGKGIDALIPKDLDKSILTEDNQRIQNLSISDIKPSSDQPRREFDPSALADLTASIKQHGVLQPIIVTRNSSKNGYQIVAGERRYRASMAAGLTNIPAIVRSVAELERLELSLIENIQRVDLAPLEQAKSLYKLQQQFNLTLEQLSKKLGKSVAVISNSIRLLKLPENAHKALNAGQISEGHARALLALQDIPELQDKMLRSIINNGWSVRQAERFYQNVKSGRRVSRHDKPTSEQVQFGLKISKTLGAPTVIKKNVRGGQIVIKYNSDEQLKTIVSKLDELA